MCHNVVCLKRKTAKLRSMAAVLTVVGELHSLTDWHVSEASDDAELEDFYNRKKNIFLSSLSVLKTCSAIIFNSSSSFTFNG